MAGAATLIVQGAIGYALIAGLGVSIPRVASEAITLIALPPERPPPPPEKVKPPPKRIAKPQGKAAPPNIRSKATQIVAPPPIVQPPPPPIIAAPVAGIGHQATQGAALVAGPGTGAGGVGNGTGAGGRGNGAGSGAETPPRRIRGRLRDSDYPREAGESGAQGSVGVRFTVERDGRVDQCVIEHSSGNEALDSTTCRLIEQRYRYRAARDADGNPVRSYVVEEHDWAIEPEPEAGR